MAILRLTALLIALAAGAALAWDPSPYRYDPTRLEALAIVRAQDGDWAAARILLERAARLVPGDARIARSLEDVRAGRVPSAPPPPPSPAPSASAKPSRAVPPEPPALWPPRP